AEEPAKAMAFFRHMGFNLIRFGIFWDGAEPEPGRIDREYLSRVKAYIQEAEKNGIYVMVDMHQDLFAQKYGDGAPDWACLDEGLPHPDNCRVWYEAYLSSEAIIRAADNFWANKPTADGVGLLDHYEKMWEVIADTLKDCPNVIGLEPMNEPFMGSLARNAFGQAQMQLMQKNPAFSIQDPSKATPEEIGEFMGIVAGHFLQFDKTTLMDFYRRMAHAISKTSDLAIITGGNIYCSTDLPTGIERLEGISQIYGPHGYDSVVDTDNYAAFSQDNVERLYQHKREAQDQLGLPTIAAEWGAFPSRDFTNLLIRDMNSIVERNLWGSAYCEYHPGMDQNPNFTSLRRAYPMATAGWLTAYHYDEAQRLFTVSFEAEPGESLIFLPFVDGKVTVDGEAKYQLETLGENALLKISTRRQGKVSITVQEA
ncbi:MAG: cellulase family glycosylhydrolase, partial [Firmicutes bacterium]|nr:cellulase family glycosylhydrolase [Bacillota bacterium]